MKASHFLNFEHTEFAAEQSANKYTTAAKTSDCHPAISIAQCWLRRKSQTNVVPATAETGNLDGCIYTTKIEFARVRDAEIYLICTVFTPPTQNI